MKHLLLAAAFPGGLPASLPAFGQNDSTEYTVLLDWFFNPDHGPLMVAEALGYFDEAGLDVILIEPADPTAPPFQVAAGQGDIAISYQPDFHLLTHQGVDIQWVGTIVDSPLNSLVVSADGPIQTLADLKGNALDFLWKGSKLPC